MALTPAVSAFRLLTSILLGGALGILSSFLQPPGRKHRHLMDLIFSLGTVWVWIYHSFAVCRGDISIWYTLSLFLGCFLEEITAGRLLRPVFDLLWRPVWKLQAFLEKIFEKTAIFLKKIFTSGKK